MDLKELWEKVKAFFASLDDGDLDFLEKARKRHFEEKNFNAGHEISSYGIASHDTHHPQNGDDHS